MEGPQSIPPGKRVRITRDDGLVVEGIVMPRYELSSPDHLVVKLDNGYNIGIRLDRIVRLDVLEEYKRLSKPGEPVPLVEELSVAKDRRVAVLGTGGTIASRIDYETGAVKPQLDADELALSIPEAFRYASLDVEEILSIFSENMKPRHWELIAEKVYRKLKEGYDGVVVAHGTDTMGYTAAALSFAFHKGLPAPVVLVGAQRSSDRPSSDAAFNFTAAVLTASRAPFAEVVVVMHGETGDSYALAHRGTRVRKMHTSRRDAFQSINAPPLAKVYPDKGEIVILDHRYRERVSSEPVLENGFEDRVALLKFFPGRFAEVLDAVASAGYRGIVVEGSGFGHVDEEAIKTMRRIIKDGVPIVVTSQTIFGRVNLRVYATGRKMLLAGVIPGDDMIPETAYVKLSWVLARARDMDEVRSLMEKPLAWEKGERQALRLYPRWDHDYTV
ncbi:MAG: Glu-tRNA(Gln) amidotransferase subunit GatD [Desulfurococcales archaeon]|nr:Glu-tRNA(Gln) amidotransferase subunit GatD [Desulfurococcales archaeon]